jgi:predicted O-methyltransferase YrrM
VRLPWRDLAPGSGPAINTSLTEAETAELKRLAAGRSVLEVGSAYGYSTVALALVAEHVTAVDPHTWLASYESLMANLGVYGLAQKVTVLREDGRAVLPRLVEQGATFGLVWIDGDHAASMVAHDVSWGQKLLAPGGVLACHDYDEDTCPGVRQALDEWRPYTRLVDTLAIFEDVA